MPHSTALRIGADGLHLFNRKTGLNILFDDITFDPETWSKAPRNVSIAITNSCNLKCSYCYAPKNNAELYFSKLTEWFDELNANGCHGICLGGGEPTLHKDFSRICHYLSKKTNLSVSFTTNAIDIPEGAFTELIGNVHFIRISLNEWFFLADNTDDSIKEFARAIDKLRRISSIGINFVITNDNIKYIDRVYDFAVVQNAKELLLLPEISKDGKQMLNYDNMQKLRCWVRQKENPIRLSISENSSDGFPFCIPLKKESRLFSYVHIDANGNLKASSFDDNGTHIDEKGFMQAFSFLCKTEDEYENLARVRF